MRNKRGSTAVQRWGAKVLTLLLVCALMAGLAVTASARDTWQGEVVDPVIPKPVVTIQGNLVTENGKPTGFYELALCVQSGCTIVENATGDTVAQADYDAAVAADPAEAANYTVTYYPFRTASAAVNVNTDILTAVSWDLQSVTYETYDADNGVYPSDASAASGTLNYPRGIDTDPTVQGYTISEAEAFPDITTPNLTTGGSSVALDVEGDTRMYTVEGAAEHFEDNAALITLSASAPDNYSVVLPQSTPLVVARFSYDLKRAGSTAVSQALSGVTAQRNSVTGEVAAGADGFWLGWDKTTGWGDADFSGKQPLTWLGQSDSATLYDFTASDDLTSRTQGNQAVWVSMGANASDLTSQNTYFYYYLAAETDPHTTTGTVKVYENGTTTEVTDVTLPTTVGETVLTEGTDNNQGATPAGYTYFKNLLTLDDGTLRLALVNQASFKQSTGGTGGVQVLFYDWDDTLLGATIVDPKGDVRAQVNAYVEENMVHPDLRAGDILAGDLGGTLPDLSAVTAVSGSTDPAARYKAILDSNDREWTYRGKYSSVVDGSGVVRDSGDAEPGEEYPLTNKLDYVFYRHINTETVLEYQDSAGAAVTDRYVSTAAVSTDEDAALYPWVYGWAVVADGSARNQTQWQVRRDAAQVENVWTTFDVGELSGLDPSYDTGANPGVQSVPAAPASGTLTTTYPAFVDASSATPPTDYAYLLSTAGDSGYLRFADFSAIEGELTRPGQDVLIVKAVYEPGTELQDAPYWVSEDPTYNKLNARAASEGGAYSAEITLERANNLMNDGYVRGSKRVRYPAIRQDTTVDQKWLSDESRGFDHDLDNPTITTAKNMIETTYTQIDAGTGDELTFTLSLSARQNKVDYFLIDTYGNNFVAGDQHSTTNYSQNGATHVIDNYYYFGEDADQNDAFFDQNSYYYQAARYDVRDGTHGFVLYGTLNYLMEQATLLNRGDITRADFNEGAGYATFQDANLRIMVDGQAEEASLTTQTALREAVIAAAADCEANHYGDGDYWDAKLDCAQLTYHQLQHYLLGSGLLSRAAADAAPIDWCHLHRACFKDEQGANAPQSWQEILDCAADPAKQDAISLLGGGLTGRIEELTSLRVNAAGDPFPSGAAFQTAIVKAVDLLSAAKLDLTWCNVQYAILNGAAPADSAAGEAAALADYWWYAGAGSRPAAGSLADLAEAGADYWGAALKDGATVSGWTFKLAGLEDAYNNMYTGADGVGQGWLDLTENLAAAWTVNDDGSETATSFFGAGISYADFQTALMDAVKLGMDAGADSAGADYWAKLQYALFYHAWPAAGESELDRYWWHNGGKLLVVTDVKSMLEIAAVSGAGEEGETAWASFDETRFAGSAFDSVRDLRLYFDGTGAVADNFTAFKAAVAAFAKNSGIADQDPAANAALWTQLQYWLIHGNYDVASMNGEINLGYYWWQGGGTSGSAVSITGVASFANAGFSSKINGNTAAWDGLTQAAINAFYLRDPVKTADPGKLSLETEVNDDKYTSHTDMPELAPDKLIAAAEALVSARLAEQLAADPAGHYHRPPSLSWLDLQHYVTAGGDTDWTDDFADETAALAYYWWSAGAANPNKTVETGLTKFLNELQAQQDAGTLETYIDGLTKDDFLADGLHLRVVQANDTYTTANLAKAKTRLKSLIAAVGSAGDSITGVTWYQLQYAMLASTAAQGTGGDGAYQSDPDTARTWYINNLDTANGGKFKTDWRPDWLVAEEAAAGLSARLDGDAQLLEAAPATEEELAAQIAALEEQLAALKDQLAQVQSENTAGTQSGTSSTSTSTGTNTSTRTESPAEDDGEGQESGEQAGSGTETSSESQAPAQTGQTGGGDHYDERPELPLGEEAVPITGAWGPAAPWDRRRRTA